MTRKPPLFLRLLPKRLLSRVMGLLAVVPLPGFLLRPLLRGYARAFRADLDEMAAPLRSFRTFRGFFTRTLRPDARPQHPDPAVIGSPCDGRVCRGGRIEAGTLVQAKGIEYRVAELLGSDEEACAFEGGSYLVLYLAPGDYHRFHWPFDGRVRRVRHVPGELWSVDARAVETVAGLYVRNERIVVTGDTAGGGRFAYVPVGALNVGSIRLSFHPLRTNQWRRRAPRTLDLTHDARRGDEFGWFELGSSIVLLLSPDAGRLDDLAPDTPVRVGMPLGRLALGVGSGPLRTS